MELIVCRIECETVRNSVSICENVLNSGSKGQLIYFQKRNSLYPAEDTCNLSGLDWSPAGILLGGNRVGFQVMRVCIGPGAG